MSGFSVEDGDVTSADAKARFAARSEIDVFEEAAVVII